MVSSRSRLTPFRITGIFPPTTGHLHRNFFGFAAIMCHSIPTERHACLSWGHSRFVSVGEGHSRPFHSGLTAFTPIVGRPRRISVRVRGFFASSHVQIDGISVYCGAFFCFIPFFCGVYGSFLFGLTAFTPIEGIHALFHFGFAACTPHFISSSTGIHAYGGAFMHFKPIL